MATVLCPRGGSENLGVGRLICQKWWGFDVLNLVGGKEPFPIFCARRPTASVQALKISGDCGLFLEAKPQEPRHQPAPGDELGFELQVVLAKGRRRSRNRVKYVCALCVHGRWQMDGMCGSSLCPTSLSLIFIGPIP